MQAGIANPRILAAVATLSVAISVLPSRAGAVGQEARVAPVSIEWSALLPRLALSPEDAVVELRSAAAEENQVPESLKVPVLEALQGALTAEVKVDLLHHLYFADPAFLLEALERAAVVAPEASVRGAAAELLSRFPSPKILEMLRDLATSDASPLVRGLAREGLFLVDPPVSPTLAELREAMEMTRQPADRRAIASRLGALEDPAAQELLWRILETPGEHEMVLVTALEGLDLSQLGALDSTHSLENLLEELRLRGASTSVLDVARSRLGRPVAGMRGVSVE